MSDRDPEVPPAGEEIHIPGASLQPLLLAIGITLSLVGLTIGRLVMITGLVLTVCVIIRWISDTRRDMAALPEDLDAH